MTDNIDCLLCIDPDDSHVLAHTAAGYVKAMTDNDGHVMTDSYAIVPWTHHVDLGSLPAR